MDEIQKKQMSYLWEGTQHGQVIKGEISGPNQVWIKVKLQRQGVVVTKISRADSIFKQKHNFNKISSTQITLFTQQLYSLIKVGFSIVQALQLLISTEKGTEIRAMMQSVITTIESGRPLSEALKVFSKNFDHFYINLIEVGESSGTLVRVLELLLNYRRRSEQLAKKLKQALKYPLFVIMVAGGVTLMMLVKVVPSFEHTFSQFNAQLPSLTLYIMRVSHWVTAYYVHITLGTLCWLATFIMTYRYNRSFKFLVDKYCLKFPIVGELMKMNVMARICRVLATTFNAGITLDKAITYSISVQSNDYYQVLLTDMKESIMQGNRLNHSMTMCGGFTPFVIQLVALGEDSGQLNQSFGQLAEHYEQEVEQKIDQMIALMEPCLMIVLGGVVGVLVMAIYLPMFELGSVM